MPRAKKVPIAPNSTTYGERQELEQMQDLAPAPRATVDENALSIAATNTALAMPSQMPPGGALGQPTTRPNEPITAGLPIGAGAGPEALGQSPGRSSNIQKQLQQAAEMTNNPVLQRMVQQTRQRPRPRPPIPPIHR